jgi:hypothetical protein
MGKANSKLSPEQISDLQKCTYCTVAAWRDALCTFLCPDNKTEKIIVERKELQAWYKGFLRDYPTGILEKADFHRLYKQFFPFGDPVPFADRVFEVFTMGTDASQIGFREFMVSLSVTSRGKRDDKLKCKREKVGNVIICGWLVGISHVEL